MSVCVLLIVQLALPVRAATPPAETSVAANLDPRLQEWIGDPSVRAALTSSDFAVLEAELRGLDGYLGVYPETSGTYRAYWEGGVPAKAPRQSGDGRQVRHVPDTRAEPLIARASTSTSAISLHDLEPRLGAGAAGPMTPGPVQGIGPGGAIRMVKADATGRIATYICSASYLFQHPATDVYYLATAGHCLLDEGALTSSEDPEARARSVQLCYADCMNNSVGLGKYVELRPDDAYPGYHPVAWAEQRGIGEDFGFIEIPRSLNPLLRSSLWFWGGPTGFKRPALGTPLVHYGFGIGLGQVVATQGRAAVTVTSSKTGGQGAIGWVNGGDSGSAFGTAALRDEMVLGDGASGAITHAVAGVGLPLMWGTDMENALDRSQTDLGTRLLLVTEDGATQGPSPSPGPSGPTASPSPSSSPTPTPSPTPEPTATPTPEPSPTPPTATPAPTATPTPEPSTPQPSPSPSPSPEPPTNAEEPDDRGVSLRSSRSAIEAGESVRLRGSITSSDRCTEDQPVNVLARKGSQKRFRNIRRTKTSADGRFAVRLRPRHTRSYRIVVPASEECERAVSRTVTVRVRGRRSG